MKSTRTSQTEAHRGDSVVMHPVGELDESHEGDSSNPGSVSGSEVNQGGSMGQLNAVVMEAVGELNESHEWDSSGGKVNRSVSTGLLDSVAMEPLGELEERRSE